MGSRVVSRAQRQSHASIHVCSIHWHLARPYGTGAHEHQQTVSRYGPCRVWSSLTKQRQRIHKQQQPSLNGSGMKFMHSQLTTPAAALRQPLIHRPLLYTFMMPVRSSPLCCRDSYATACIPALDQLSRSGSLSLSCDQLKSRNAASHPSEVDVKWTMGHDSFQRVHEASCSTHDPAPGPLVE